MYTYHVGLLIFSSAHTAEMRWHAACLVHSLNLLYIPSLVSLGTPSTHFLHVLAIHRHHGADDFTATEAAGIGEVPGTQRLSQDREATLLGPGGTRKAPSAMLAACVSALQPLVDRDVPRVMQQHNQEELRGKADKLERQFAAEMKQRASSIAGGRDLKQAFRFLDRRKKNEISIGKLSPCCNHGSSRSTRLVSWILVR